MVFLDLEGHGIITGVSLDLPLILTLTEAYIRGCPKNLNFEK